jgi:signal transduction histidine kinase/CheY-like chemotaxis protein/HPt (histidine-containing phosphotransfer) domain-containing protein
MECARRVKLNGMNGAAMRLFGIQTLDELDRENYFLIGQRPQHIFGIACAIWNGETKHHAEGPYTRVDGTEVPVAYSLRIPKTLDEARRVPFLVLDLSDVKAAAEAREANVAKSRFLASMSHEIRTPLNGIIANLELLAQTDLHDSQAELLDDADKAAKSLLALIGNILDFSKIEAGKLAIEMGEVELESLLHQTIDILQSKARQKGIFIATSLGADVPHVIRGDIARLRQILLNLVGNAIKFTHQGGVHLMVRVLDWDGAVCLLEFAVHDSGVGFDPAETSRLFESFAQAQSSVTRTHEDGTGLGLSICRSLVETFGGEITAEGAPGEGATFRFTLPAECVKPASAERRADLSGRTVMLIGGAEPGLAALAAYCVERHATIERFESMAEALEASQSAEIRGRHFDVAMIGALSGNPRRDRECIRLLRQHRMVPMVIGDPDDAAAWRRLLRAGVSYITAGAGDDTRLDRNIASLIGTGAGAVRNAATAPKRNAVLPDFGGMHVLVLEDRLVNQTVIQRQLRQFKIACTMAADGYQGLQQLKLRPFDLVLADCSMPNMDGFEFTRQVRRQEAEAGTGHRLPIIALTANAFREDAEKCFAAGMDDFLSKPVTLERLGAVLERWLKPGASAKPVRSAPAHPSGDAAPIDMPALSELMGTSDDIVLRDVLREFALAARPSFDETARCVAERDMPGIVAAAHGAKGEARNVAARRLGELYAELEAKARARDVASTALLLDDIRRELARVEAFIAMTMERAA